MREAIERGTDSRGRQALRVAAPRRDAERDGGVSEIGAASCVAAALRGTLRRLAGDELGAVPARPTTW
jgi:hypothetical protein